MERSKKNVAGVVSSFGVLITLSVTLISGLNIIYSIIEQLIVDETNAIFSLNFVNDDLSIAISTFIVFFPLFIYASQKMVSNIKDLSPEETIGKTQNVAVAFIVSIATLILAIATITFIYYVLTGGLTLHFTLKLLSTVVVAVIVFSYYKAVWNRKFSGVVLGKKSFGTTVVAFSIALVVLGVYIIDPLTIDERKEVNKTLNYLNVAQTKIERMWDKERVLPNTMQLPKKNDLLYTKTSATTYTLCANLVFVFKHQNLDNYPYRNFPYDTEGKNCFDFTAGKIPHPSALYKFNPNYDY